MENNFYEKYPAYNKPLVELQREREILEGRYGNDSIALKKIARILGYPSVGEMQCDFFYKENEDWIKNWFKEH